MARTPRTAEEFFDHVMEAYVSSEEGTDCWEWIGARNYSGRARKAGDNYSFYGAVNIRDQVTGRKYMKQAHNYMYEELVGPIPEGRVLHHKCLNALCVNPEHLIPLTPSEHNLVHAQLRKQKRDQAKSEEGS